MIGAINADYTDSASVYIYRLAVMQARPANNAPNLGVGTHLNPLNHHNSGPEVNCIQKSVTRIKSA